MREASSSTSMEHLRVTPEESGQRLDRYLALRLPQLSRTRIQELVAEGRVLVAGRTSRASHRVADGESIQVEVISRPALAATPEEIPIEILYEDEDIVVVNKPAGMIVHAGGGQSRGTLVNALLHRLGKLSSVAGTIRPGIVHRLDRGTSGTLVVARNDRAHRILTDQFAAREVEKVYLTLVTGRMKEDIGRIELPVARDLQRRTRMTTRRREGREARTDWKALTRVDGFTLLEVRLHTGRTHQIRVHFSAIGHPVVGDTTYGAPRQPQVGEHKLASLGRPFLHAARIGFLHPTKGERVAFRASLESGLHAYLVNLAAAAGMGQALIDAALKGYL
ncbi:MAG TPA: RluA family pseudouridine synthase [Candidatus Limnocylindrales bacterium]|nr:RluA family pseudouridine synthase [Candidatus Limnocylindrales bacterium]